MSRASGPVAGLFVEMAEQLHVGVDPVQPHRGQDSEYRSDRLVFGGFTRAEAGHEGNDLITQGALGEAGGVVVGRDTVINSNHAKAIAMVHQRGRRLMSALEMAPPQITASPLDGELNLGHFLFLVSEPRAEASGPTLPVGRQHYILVVQPNDG